MAEKMTAELLKSAIRAVAVIVCFELRRMEQIQSALGRNPDLGIPNDVAFLQAF